MSLQITQLREKHWQEAASLVAEGYRSERNHVQPLPLCYEDDRFLLRQLGELAASTEGVAAIRNGRMVGFLLGQVLPSWRGSRAVYCSEWAHSSGREQKRETYRAMHARISRDWIADGCFTHLITILAHEQEAIDAQFWSGFGLAAVDAVRSVDAVHNTIPPPDIRRARLEDIESLISLCRLLEQHMSEAPICLSSAETPNRQFLERELASPAHATWVAWRGQEPVAFLGVGPANPSACHIIQDEHTVSITRAFAREEVRSKGIGTALLGCALDWARSQGHRRCAVDFEPENVPGSLFWLRYFQPICYTLVRRIL